jgi:hypothetical protein
MLQQELEFRREMQRLERSGGYTTNDYTCYGFTSPTANLDEALWRSVDAWMAPKLSEPKVAATAGRDGGVQPGEDRPTTGLPPDRAAHVPRPSVQGTRSA